MHCWNTASEMAGGLWGSVPSKELFCKAVHKHDAFG